MTIQQKMITLNDILQIGELISASVGLEKILDTVLEKLSHIYEMGFAVCYLAKDKPNEFVMYNYINVHDIGLLGRTVTLGEGFLGMAVLRKKAVVIDSSTSPSSDEYICKGKLKLVNLVVMPIFTGKEIRGLLLVGNHMKEFIYTNEDLDMMKIFTKQLSISVENHMLAKRAEALSVRDDLTGLYNEPYILARLNEEIERGVVYQRPCSLIIIDIDDFKKHTNEQGQLSGENLLKKVAGLVKGILVEPVDKAGRIGDDSFAVILPEKNKKRAIEIAKKIKDMIQTLRVSGNRDDGITASMGVSENPLDGSSATELMSKAAVFLKSAKENGKNRVES